MPKKVDAKRIERRINEALEILELLGFPGQQQNERSALTLRSLLALKPGDAWRSASDPLMGITPMMD
jgi:adenine-specific DNA-methyltransferase